MHSCSMCILAGSMILSIVMYKNHVECCMQLLVLKHQRSSMHGICCSSPPCLVLHHSNAGWTSRPHSLPHIRYWNLSCHAGVKLILTPSTSAMFKRAGMLAADGRCKTLDSTADGYVRGEACASAMLQLVTKDMKLSAAVACVLGSAENQDGRSSSLTAPNGPSQQGVIRQALRGSGLQPYEVGVLQMHGTGMAPVTKTCEGCSY